MNAITALESAHDPRPCPGVRFGAVFLRILLHELCDKRVGGPDVGLIGGAIVRIINGDRPAITMGFDARPARAGGWNIFRFYSLHNFDSFVFRPGFIAGPTQLLKHFMCQLLSLWTLQLGCLNFGQCFALFRGFHS